ncbi:hypothetical protein HPB50_027323 [Hyalomma asiaticum]|uniref:Uncharacterized protein n=1 Tax=Hyalomma asiaticum TaxID=266040 RepID=A0ACB7S377_HYAAI|nr:hypothetical protein HPB50_027323 [Hyalomma asiaticum]
MSRSPINEGRNSPNGQRATPVELTPVHQRASRRLRGDSPEFAPLSFTPRETRTTDAATMTSQMYRSLDIIGVENLTGLLCSNLNLKRPAAELQALFASAAYACRAGLKEIKILRQMGVQVRFVGELETVPTELQAKLLQIELATSCDNGRRDVTVCVAYSSRQEITRMVKDFASAVKQGRMDTRDITATLIEDYLKMSDGPDAQLWYRSAGEVRFSDILLLQNGYSYMHVEKKQWPSINHWDLLLAIIQFQNNWPLVMMRCGMLILTIAHSDAELFEGPLKKGMESFELLIYTAR